MKQQDIQLAVLSIAGIILFGISAPSGVAEKVPAQKVLGDFSEFDCGSGAKPCVDVEVQTYLLEDELSSLDRDVTYRVTVTNHGPSEAKDIKIKNLIPRSSVPLSFSGDIVTGSYAPSYDFYFIPHLGSGETTFIEIKTQITPVSCGFVETVTTGIVSVDGFDVDRSNNFDSTMLSVPSCSKWNQVAAPL